MDPKEFLPVDFLGGLDDEIPTTIAEDTAPTDFFANLIVDNISQGAEIARLDENARRIYRDLGEKAAGTAFEKATGLIRKLFSGDDEMEADALDAVERLRQWAREEIAQ